MQKLTYPKQTLTELTKVTSESLKEKEQSYRIIYLEKTNKFIDKVRIYLYDREPDKCNPRSLSFLNPEQLLTFIKESVSAYLKLKEERIKPELQISLEQYRTEVLMIDLLKSIKESQLNKWNNKRR